jgi:hypothetical protein
LIFIGVANLFGSPEFLGKIEEYKVRPSMGAVDCLERLFDPSHLSQCLLTDVVCHRTDAILLPEQPILLIRREPRNDRDEIMRVSVGCDGCSVHAEIHQVLSQIGRTHRPDESYKVMHFRPSGSQVRPKTHILSSRTFAEQSAGMRGCTQFCAILIL